MEQSLSSLAFKGSIAEAIGEAKRQKKLFVVYIGGDNPESKHLETATWTDLKVSETLTKYCVLLHILEGSSEASYFSAIYPQNSTPSITAVGYNGVQLWQTEGFTAADVLATSLEMAWLSLHAQETTAAVLTAALASEKQRTSGSSMTSVSPEQQALGANESSPSTENQIPLVDNEPSTSELIEERHDKEDDYKEAEPKVNAEALSIPPHASVVDTRDLNMSTSNVKVENASLDSVQRGQNNDKEVTHSVSCEKSVVPDVHLGRISGTPQETADKASEVAHTNTLESADIGNVHTPESSAIKSNDVFLNIKLPDGLSIQIKLSVIDPLRTVKDRINDNPTMSLGSFDLAIPYPRKVFNDQELDCTLSELGLFNRQALVVVPRKQTSSHYGRASSSQSETYSSNDAGSSNGNAGYWASVKRIISYVNPLSYLSGGASSPAAPAQESENGLWQYSPNSSLQNNLRAGTSGPSTDSSPDQSKPANANSSGIRQRTSRFGGNIHTLKHDEDDDQFKDRNTFWNGNSTEFGGDNDGK